MALSKIMASALAILLVIFTGVSAQVFGTSGISARELPTGLCVIEIDEAITENSDESLEIVITETGRKPAFAKVQSLLIYGEDEDSKGLEPGQLVFWSGEVKTVARTLNGVVTGVPEKSAVFKDFGLLLPTVSGSSVDLVFSGMASNGFPIASQGTAGEIRTGIRAINPTESTFDLHIVAAITSPVGNLCSMNLIPVRTVSNGGGDTLRENGNCREVYAACLRNCGANADACTACGAAYRECINGLSR